MKTTNPTANTVVPMASISGEFRRLMSESTVTGSVGVDSGHASLLVGGHVVSLFVDS